MCHILPFLSFEILKFEILESKGSTAMWNTAVIKGKSQWRNPRHPALQKTNQNLHGMLPSWQHADEKIQKHSSYLKAQNAGGLQHSCKGSESSCKPENLHRWNAKNGCLIVFSCWMLCFITASLQQSPQKGSAATATCSYCIFFNTRHGKLKSASLCCSPDFSQDWGCLFLTRRLRRWGPHAA